MYLEVSVLGLLQALALAVLNGVPSSYYETRPLASVISRFPNIPDGQAMICGGVVIAPNTVLTAAHCVYDGDTLWVSADVWPSLLHAAFFHVYEKLHFFLFNVGTLKMRPNFSHKSLWGTELYS